MFIPEEDGVDGQVNYSIYTYVHLHIHVQWNLSNPDIIGADLIERCP